MNEFNDPLEAELHSLRPNAPSAELKERIADRLARGQGGAASLTASRWKQYRFPLAIAGSFVAAAVALALLLPGPPREPFIYESPDTAPQPSVATAFDDSAPSLWQFQRALSHSASDIDGLLDRYSGATLTPAHEQTPIRGFGQFDTTISNFPGEL